jgi:MFS family permease
MKDRNEVVQLKRNIPRNYLFIFLSNFHLTNGVWMLYLASKGLSLFEIGLMESVFHVASFFFEVPTGAVADLYGRKFSRVLGRVFAILNILIMIFAQDLVWFAVAFAVHALSYNLESGAGEALLYDSVKLVGEKERFLKISGRQELFYQLASAASLVVGGFVAQFDYALVYKVSMIVAICTLLFSFSFKEPPLGERKEGEPFWRGFRKQIGESLYVLTHHSTLGFMLLATELFGALATTVFFYSQNRMLMLGYNEFAIGLVLSIGGLCGALFTWNAHRIEKLLGFQRAVAVLTVLGALSFWAVYFRVSMFVGMVLVLAMESTMYVIVLDYVNRLIKSEKRATLISFQSMIFSLMMILIFPLVGKIGDIWGMDRAFLFVAILGTVSLAWIHVNFIISG